ncbi:MAG: hypothetical protein AVDCRST_MAG93-5549, partial [uncultured Chloroflexia bacterium]
EQATTTCSAREPIQAVREAVKIEYFARGLGCDFRRAGADELVTRRPLPDHEDRTPSCTVKAAKGVFFCYLCLRGGDVAELVCLIGNMPKDDAVLAAVEFAHRYGTELPQRPDPWFAKNELQRPIRDDLDRVAGHSVRRRILRFV